MIFAFKVDAELSTGIKRLSDILGFSMGDGITVSGIKGSKIGVCYNGNSAVIYYREKVHFFRELCILVEKMKESKPFELYEDGFFETVGTMIDSSRCAVQKLSAIKEMIDRLAIMGYNMMMLYTEDVIEVEGYPYLGYMRGRYTASDIKEIDDYAYEYGIEIIPCIECYGHMEKYLIWPEAAAIKDTQSVLLAREEKTFEFIEALIRTVSSSLRSKRIHIGMDEAWDMGRGNFLDKHGYVHPFEIFKEYVERLISITDKYGLRAMLWSDMYFRISSKNSRLYYDRETELSEEVKASIPEKVELVFWHYGEEPFCDDYMLKKHNDLGRKTIFAGGNWGWIGHFPEHNYMMETTAFSLSACRKNEVREAIFTIWTNDNAECDLFANLYGLSYFAEQCYNPNISQADFEKRFEAATDADAELFYKMSYYHNDFENSLEYKDFNDRFLGKHLFWQDIMAGIYDTHLFNKPMSSHYMEAASLFEGRSSDGRWGYLYDYAYRAMDYLAAKCLIAENLVPAYKASDRDMLEAIAKKYLPELKEKTAAVHKAHKAAWLKNNRTIGWQNLDIRYGGVIARCDTAIEIISAYLAGEIPFIDELCEPRLHKDLCGFSHYSGIATVNKKI